ncbi:MAG: hypothetical protein KAQ89_00705 [Planctomycetes bacterium]|nr:hypothetical protein [Planctomycetota bacterium]
MKKKTDNLFSELPCCAKDFIELVIKKMRYRKKVRADVMVELVAHFEDELRDCKTDEEKQQRAQQLIEEFGDVKLLATLLRRAKRRCRPLWRAIVARTFQTIGIIILCFILYLGWFLSGKPVITTDYVAELNKIARPVADANLNAVPLYHKAAESVENLPDDIKKLLSKKYREATAEQKQLIAKWLTDNKEIFELVIAGTHKPYYWQKYEGEEMIAVLMPNLSGFRILAHSLRWRAWLRAEQSRYEDAFSDVKTCYRLGQHLKDGKTLIEQLVGIGIEALSVQTIRDILSEYEINSATLTALQQNFENLIVDEDFTISFEGERMFMYDGVQRCFTVDKIGGGHIDLKKGVDYMLMCDGASSFRFTHILRILFTHPNRQETLISADKFYDYLQQLALKTPAHRQAKQDSIDEETRRIIRGNLFLEILAPTLNKVIELSYRIKTDVQATSTIIAILRYAQDKGDYPENLEQLVTSGYLKELPTDPWSDKPLIYKKTKDDFVLYSVGLNFVDDGGVWGTNKKGKVKQWAEEGDAVFWPVEK